jgi:hypothetical protein
MVPEEHTASILKPKMEVLGYVPPKRWHPVASPHGVTTHKNAIDVLTAVRT